MPLNNNSGATRSLWMEVELPAFPTLTSDKKVDVAIVGGGIAGLTCAYALSKLGKSVIVIDQGAIAGGQTARTTAHLSWVLGERYYELEKFFGKDGIKIIAESHAAAIDLIEKIIKEEKIDCDFERVDGYLFTPPEESKDILDKELATLKKIGMEVQKIERAPCCPSFDTETCLKFPKQAQFHVMKYLKGLTEAIVKQGGEIFSNTHAKHFEDGSPCTVKTESGFTITAGSIIVATCTPVNNRVFIHTKQAAYRTYAIAASIPKGSVQTGLFWDTMDPYHYVRLQKDLNNPDADWLIIGGEDHKTGQDPDIESKYSHLEKWAKKRFSMIKKIEHHWSGQVFETMDSIAFIGRNPEDKNIYIATGDCGNGITHGTIAGILLPDLILKKDHPWKNLYDPSRKTLSAIKEYLEENINAISQYKDLLTPGEKGTVETLAPGEGMILRDGLKRIAVYKDKENKIHVHSGFCTHLGGCLQWNCGEKSWDCPVHGARFDGCGHVLNGPAINDLKPEKEGSI